MSAAHNFIDIRGQAFGDWSVLGRAENTPQGNARWHCLCSCGNTGTVSGGHLRSGVSRSCGSSRHGHGQSKTPTHYAWSSLKQRCLNTDSPAYPSYGGRGITVCGRWRASFAAFFEDMGEKPNWATGGLDRIDNNGGYWCGHCEECARLGRAPNCRWSTTEQQRKNQRPRFLEDQWWVLLEERCDGDDEKLQALELLRGAA